MTDKEAAIRERILFLAFAKRNLVLRKTASHHVSILLARVGKLRSIPGRELFNEVLATLFPGLSIRRLPSRAAGQFLVPCPYWETLSEMIRSSRVSLRGEDLCRWCHTVWAQVHPHFEGLLARAPRDCCRQEFILESLCRSPGKVTYLGPYLAENS